MRSKGKGKEGLEEGGRCKGKGREVREAMKKVMKGEEKG